MLLRCMLQLLASLVFLVKGAHGVLRFASYYQDHMVLQRGPQRAVVWGYAANIGDIVIVQISGHLSVVGEVIRDARGKGIWKVKLPPIANEGPFTVTAASSEGFVEIEDVLFGDVWICSGQSNMEWTVNQSFNNTEEVADSLKYTDIRIMEVGRSMSGIPLADQPGSSLVKWTQPTSAAVGGFSAVCWFFGRELYSYVRHPIGLIEADWEGTNIQAWSSADAIAACSTHRVKRGPKVRSVLWNPMINPLTSLTIYGALWYQGEGNRPNPELYACQVPAMINDWRRKFHEGSLGETSVEFPFGFVQLSGFRISKTTIGQFPPVRWSQTAKYGEVPNDLMKNVFMAVSMDLPDFALYGGSIHPRNKQDVSKRLVLGARALAYSDVSVEYRGPFPKAIYDDKTNRRLHIVYNHGPIEVRNNDGFEVCCSTTSTTCGSSDIWLAAPIQSHQRSDLFISTSGCGTKNAVGVRYAWRESPCDVKQCAIYGRDTSLPAPPYIRTDGLEAAPDRTEKECTCHTDVPR